MAVSTAMITLSNLLQSKEGDPPPPSMEGSAESIKDIFVVIGF
jgi:hypothetical protein